MNIFNGTAARYSYGIAALGFAAFAIQLGFGWRGGKLGGWILAAIVLSCCWAVAAAAYAGSGLPGLRIAEHLFDTLRICAWYGLLLALLFSSGRYGFGGGKNPPVWVIVAIGLLAITAFSLHSAPSLAVAIFGRGTRAGFFAPMAFAIVGLMLVEQVYRNISAHARWGIKPLCLGLGATYCFDLYMYSNAFLFNQLDIDVWSSRGVANLLIVPLIAVSTARNKDWAFEIAVSRQVVFHSTTLLGSGIYLVAIAGAGYFVRYFGNHWGGALQVMFLFAGLLIFGMLFHSGSLRSKLRVLLNKHFYNYRYDYREEWLRFTQSLTVGDRNLGLLEHAINALADLVESPGGMLWLVEPSGELRQAARLNMPEVLAVESGDGALVEFLVRTQWVIDLSDNQEQPEKYADANLPEWLRSIPDAWLVVPLAAAGELFGFIILAKSRAKIDLNWEVLDLLKTAGSQAASYIAYMRAAEALLEAKKFDSFNRMSAFVVHDMKNLVAQLSLLLKNAERHKDNPEFQADMLSTISNAVERMKQLLLQLRAGSTPVNGPCPVDLAPIVRRIEKARSGQKPKLILEKGEPIEVLGHPDRLERVIGHLVQNAIDATPDDGRVWLKLIRDKDQAIVEVGDTGHGMSREFVQEGMFKPFQTTKAAGMGIGAYESSQYIRELGGRIFVDSRENVGTVVRIELRANRSRHEPAACVLELNHG